MSSAKRPRLMTAKSSAKRPRTTDTVVSTLSVSDEAELEEDDEQQTVRRNSKGLLVTASGRPFVKKNEINAKGVLAERYDVLLHFAIAHMRRADGALAPHSSGRKALDLLAPAGEHR